MDLLWGCRAGGGNCRVGGMVHTAGSLGKGGPKGLNSNFFYRLINQLFHLEKQLQKNRN
jgi:hypothetical protein